MANSRNYRTPTRDDGPDVALWNDRLAQDVAKDVDALAAGQRYAPASQVTTRDADYLEATVDLLGNITEAVDPRGFKVLPRAVLAGADVEAYASDDYIKGTVDPQGNVAEDALDTSGRVPAWVLAEWSRRMGTNAATLPVDVIVVAGQSNATKRSTLPVTVEDTDPRVLYWDGANMVPEAGVQWIGSGFAREYARTVPGRRVLLVPTANGSTGFTTTTITPAPAGYHNVTGEAGKGTWDRTLADPINHYDQMVAATKAALAAAGSDARLVAMIWSQGESDRGYLDQAQYSAKLDDLIASARTALAAPSLPVLIGSMTPETIWDNAGGTLDIHRAILDTPRRVQSTSYTWGPPNQVEYQNSRVHWSPQGQAIRGQRMASEGLYRARLNVAAAKPIQAQGTTVTRSGSQVSIRWSPPPCRVTAYALEVSTDSGATWAAQALSSPIITEHDLTVSPALPVWARIKTTNDIGTSDWTREAKA